MGWNTRELRIEKSPSAVGSGEQWVREKFSVELKIYRQRQARAASALIAITDADNHSVEERKYDFSVSCSEKQIPFRQDGEAVAIAVPKMNIETWIKYLDSGDATETERYPKLQRERECKSAVEKLVAYCKETTLHPDWPPSLIDACSEYRTRIMPLKN
jgi:lysyl-tRNA synthetase class II